MALDFAFAIRSRFLLQMCVKKLDDTAKGVDFLNVEMIEKFIEIALSIFASERCEKIRPRVNLLYFTIEKSSPGCIVPKGQIRPGWDPALLFFIYIFLMENSTIEKSVMVEVGEFQASIQMQVR